MKRARLRFSGRPALVVGLVAVAVVTGALTAAALPNRSAPPLLLLKGAGRAAPGGPSTLTKPRAVTARPESSKRPTVRSRPTVLHLTKAGSAVFDVRKLKSVVV